MSSDRTHAFIQDNALQDLASVLEEHGVTEEQLRGRSEAGLEQEAEKMSLTAAEKIRLKDAARNGRQLCLAQETQYEDNDSENESAEKRSASQVEPNATEGSPKARALEESSPSPKPQRATPDADAEEPAQEPAPAPRQRARAQSPEPSQPSGADEFYQIRSVFGVDYREGPNWSYPVTGDTAKFGTVVRVSQTRVARTANTATTFVRTRRGWLPLADDFGELLEKAKVQERHRLEVIVANPGQAQKLGDKDRYWRSSSAYRFIYDAVTQAAAGKRAFREGEVVQMRYRGLTFCGGGRRGWRDAEVVEVNENGTYDVAWKDSWRTVRGVEAADIRRNLVLNIGGNVFSINDSGNACRAHRVGDYPYEIVEIGPVKLSKFGARSIYIRPMIAYRKDYRNNAANIPFGTATNINDQNRIGIITGPILGLMR